MASLQIRFFAGAAQAAGCTQTELDFVPNEPLTRLLNRLAAHNTQLAEVLDWCSFLADGQRIEPQNPLPAGTSLLDVLPPFAGG